MTVTIDDVDDRVAQILTAGPGITITYSDLLDAITIATHREPEAIHDAVAELLQAGSGITLTYDDTANTLTISASVDTATLGEIVDDQVAQLVHAGENMTIVYDDNAGTLTFTAAGAPAAPDEVLVSVSAPTDPATELWFDPSATPTVDLALAALEARVAALEKGRRGRVGMYLWAWDIGGVATATMVASQARMMRVNSSQAFDQMMMNVSTGVAGSTMAFAIYETDEFGWPTNIVRSATIDTASAANKTVSFTALPAGVYWFAYLPSAAIGVYSTGTASPTFVSPQSIAGVTNNFNGWAQNAVASLPNPWAPLNGWSGATAPMPVSQIRLA